MKNIDIGGACPRRPLTHAIPRAMMHPTEAVDVAIGDCELGVFATNGTISESISALGIVAIDNRRSWLAATFADNVSTQLRGLLLMRPMAGHMYVCLVDPCLLRAGTPTILVSADRKQAFEMDEVGRLVERPVPPQTKLQKGIERAWADLTRRMLATTKSNGTFRHPSWELHLIPTGVNVP